MASGTISTRPSGEGAPARERYEEFIQKRLEQTRRQVRLVDVAIGLMLLAIASLVFFLFVAVLDQWVFHHGLSFLARLGLFALCVGAAGTFIWRFLWPPLANRINPVYAAQTIEQGRPTLKNSLINFLLLRAHPQDVAPVVYRAMEHRAAADLLKVPADHALERGRVVHLACVLAAVVGVFALYMALSPKNPFVSAARVLWPWGNVAAPTRVHIEEITPGDKSVFNDDREPISARITGLGDGEEVALLVSTADSQEVDDRVVMTRTDDADHYRCELPVGSGGFQQDTYYRITAGDAATPQYKLEVQIAPTIMVDSIDYHFPSYTGQDDRVIKNQGDIKALEGTRVTIHATANMDIQDAHIDLNCEGLQTLPMEVHGAKASGQFSLALNPDGKPRYSAYQIIFTDTNGHPVRRPVRYNIDVDRDLAPDVAIVEPQPEQVQVPENGQLAIKIHAFDPDFALRYVTLQAERVGPAGTEGDKLGLPVLLDRTKPNKAWAKPFDYEFFFRPADWNLKAGNSVSYWATAEDNKEPSPNHSESTPRKTLIIVAAGQDGQRAPQNQPQNGTDQRQQNGPSGGQGDTGKKNEEGQGDSSPKSDGPKSGERNPDQKSKQDGKSGDGQPGNKNDRGQTDQSAGQGNKDQSSSNPPQEQKGDEEKRGEPGDQADNHTNPDTQPADAIKKILNDKQEQDKKQQSQGDQANNKEKPNQKPNPGQSNESQQGGQPQNGGQGNQSPQGKPGEKKDQGGSSNPQSQPGNQDQGKEPNSGQLPQGSQNGPSGQANSKPAPQQNNPGSPSDNGSQPRGEKDAGNTSAADKKSPANDSSKSNPSSGGSSKEANSASSKPDSNSGGGNSKPEKDPSGGPQAKDQSAAGGSPQSSGKPQSAGKTQSNGTPQSGGRGPGDEQMAQNGPRPEPKKSPESGGADNQNAPGGGKPGEKPKDESGNSQAGGQGAQLKPEAKQGGSGESAGGKKPESGKNEQVGSGSDGNKPNGNKPEGGKPDSGKPANDRAGNESGEQPGQKDPGKNGNPTGQDRQATPDPQGDRQRGQQKNGDAREAMKQNSDNPQSPSTSPHDSNTSSDTSGDRSGGGGAGGGQKENKAGKGAAGTEKPADSGGAVSNERGEGAAGKKAGQDVRATDATGSSQKETGKGGGEKREPTGDQTAKNNSQTPEGGSSGKSSENPDNSKGGNEGGKASQQAGGQAGGQPAGGSQANRSGAVPPPSQQPQGGPDPANLDFTKHEVDLALEHLKEQMAKKKPELLDRLGWTKEEGQKFLENLQKLKDSAQQPGSEGEAAKKAYNEFLKNLDLHPHGTQIGGGKTETDDMRGVRDSGQMEPPSDWADLYRAYSRSTAGQK